MRQKEIENLSEKMIQDQILSFLKSKQIFAWQNKSTGTYDPTKKMFRRPGLWFKKGTSDILGILPGGLLLAIEVKTKKGRPTPEQTLFIEDITQRGGIAFIARSIEDVEKHLRGILDAGDVVTTEFESCS